jgi:aspartyl-tRNA(Asn)/glutamyl-tRNA(Gln) amidotransferase subunit B
MNYIPTIGLEIHVELNTKNKMFCSCPNDPNERHPNIHICPTCTAHPGTLPTINKEAVKKVIKLGLALNSKIPEISKFDRKNYFYPDLPKGYQISQYDKPLALGGALEFKIRLRRIHLEEDTARLIYMTIDNDNDKNQSSKVKSQKSKVSLVDFNRAGIPLMELVTEPNIKSGEEAVVFAKELQMILRYLGISDADMEKGQLRIEANVSLQPEIPSSKSQTSNKSQIQNSKLGTKVEIKNLNSFKAVEEAIDYEIKRQTEILEKGESVKHETRGWDDIKKTTVSQRAKEEAHDYRYFPEPDLPPLDLTEFDLKKLKIEIPELPQQKRERFIKEYSLTPAQVDILIEEMPVADYFEKAASELKIFIPTTDYQLLFNYFTVDLWGLTKGEKFDISKLKIMPEHFAHFIAFMVKYNLTSRMAKDVLKEMFERGVDPEEIIKEKEFDKVIGGDLLDKAAEEAISENPKAVADYKKGKENALQFLTGQAMAKLKGRADPQKLREALKNKLKI